MREHVTFVEANGLRLAIRRFDVEKAAPPNGKTALLLHGFLDSGATFELVAEPLARMGFEVIAPDFRGFGASDRVGAGGYYHFPDYVVDLDGIIRALAPKWLGVVGHSMGGGVATLFAGTFPDRVKALVVMEGLGPMNEPSSLAVERMRKHFVDRAKVRPPRPMASLDEATDRLAATHPRIGRALLRTRAERLVRKDADGKLVWAWDPLHRTASMTPFFADSYTSFLRSITCETLFVSGGPHGWHPPDEEERLASFARLRRVDFPDAGHMMHWTAPNEVAAAVAEHFSRDSG
jgi:pimeloyl-ACP methyl ester carboxylesterase